VTVQDLKTSRKQLPNLWQAVAGRRFSLPTDLVEDYVRQDSDQESAFMRMVNYRYMLIQKIVDVRDNIFSMNRWLKTGALIQNIVDVRDNIFSISRWLKYGAQVYFLEREMGEAFLNTTLLTDLRATDLFWRFPAFKICLPKGLIPIEGTDKSL
jgi:hypothetical protein